MIAAEPSRTPEAEIIWTLDLIVCMHLEMDSISPALEAAETPSADLELKMFLVVRADLPQMTPGKLAVQSGHAFTWLYDKAQVLDPETMAEYRKGSTAKICLKASNLHALQRAHNEADAHGIPAVIITDEGRTCFSEPTTTVCAIGPCRRSDLPKFIAKLQMY